MKKVKKGDVSILSGDGSPRRGTEPLENRPLDRNVPFFKILLIGFIIVSAYCAPALALEQGRITELTQAVMESQEPEKAYPVLEELTGAYFSSRQYNEYADFLKSMARKKKEFEPAADYYTALTRYYQLKYLEDSQVWEEYFSKGNEYRGTIKDSLERAAENTRNSPDVYGLCSRLLLWKFYKGRHDPEGEAALGELMDYIRRYADGPAINPEAIKEAGYELLFFDEKIRAKTVFEMYAGKLADSGLNAEELYRAALSLYKEGNLGLSESIFNLYIERSLASMPPERSAKTLIDTAKLFLYGKQKPHDAFYAETLLVKARELGGIELFDEGLMYLRALSLEKTKQYSPAASAYDELAARFGSSRRVNEALFKSGFINIYALAELKKGKAKLEELAAFKDMSAYKEAAIYQLGLLSQWENDPSRAKGHYDKVPQASRDRLDEIANGRPMEYGLRMFLDAALKGGGAPLDPASSLGLSAEPYKVNISEPLFIDSCAAPPESGCVQLDMEYIWSGQSGKTEPSAAQASFNTSYETPGPKIIGLVAQTRAGTAGYDFILIDVE